MRVNTAKEAKRAAAASAPRTHGGAIASRTDEYNQLVRSVLSTFLWEDTFYEDGVSIADRIKALVKVNKPGDVAELAILARKDYNLRHVPLLLSRELARSTSGKLVGHTITNVIQRADELAEFLAIYWQDKKDQPLSKQVKIGLANAFRKFDEYSLAKYNQDGQVKLRDVLFLCHAKPANKAQEKLWKKLIDGKLKTPDTWEVQLSAGKDKKETFERLMKEENLGALAFIRNLRNMEQAGVDEKLIKAYSEKVNIERVLPFRFLAAAKHAARFEPMLEAMMLRSLEQAPKLPGKTVIVVDVSGSMGGQLGGKSGLTRVDAGAALAMLGRELSDDVVVYATAGNDGSRVHKTELVPARRGFALRDAITKAMRELGGGGIFLTQCLTHIEKIEKDVDRVIVITDEQDCDHKLNPDKAPLLGKRGNYIVNIASYKNGIGYKKFTKIDGFSEATLKFIVALEQQLNK